MTATPQPPGGSRDPEQLERTAEQIRADLDRTLDALERKLSPSQLLDRSLEYLREHSGELTRNVGEAVRRNPVPIMLAVAGVGWLVASSLRSRTASDEEFGDESPYADARYAAARRSNSKFQDRVAAARERIHTSREAAANKFARAADATRERTRRTQYQVVSTIERQPLLLGSLAVAIGALIGALIPATDYEDRIVGQVRDRAVERAKEMGERQYRNLRSRLETHRDLEVSGRAH
jgi:ElaB/YqjD/DUF883 family membrane-anchored ribosome-binding protein